MPWHYLLHCCWSLEEVGVSLAQFLFSARRASCRGAEGKEAALKETPGTIYETPKPCQWPSVETIRAAQKRHKGPRSAALHRNANGLLVDEKNRVWLPDTDTRTRVCIAAHCGLAGHRGFHSTYGSVARFFVFDDMRKFVQDFLARCLQCIRNESGKGHGNN